MRKKFRIIVSIALIVILIGTFLFLKSRNKLGFIELPPYLLTPGAENIPKGGILLKDVTLRSLSGGKLLWKVKMKDVLVDELSEQLVVKGLEKAELQYENKTELTVTAGNLVRNQRTGNIVITDNVSITGKDIFMSTKYVEWIDKTSVLRFNSITAQFGDLAVKADNAEYDVLNASLKVAGIISVSTQGNQLSSQNGGQVKADGSSFDLKGPVKAEVSGASLEEWLVKNKMPKTPEIPQAIKERYKNYKNKK